MEIKESKYEIREDIMYANPNSGHMLKGIISEKRLVHNVGKYGTTEQYWEYLITDNNYRDYYRTVSRRRNRTWFFLPNWIKVKEPMYINEKDIFKSC